MLRNKGLCDLSTLCWQGNGIEKVGWAEHVVAMQVSKIFGEETSWKVIATKKEWEMGEK